MHLFHSFSCFVTFVCPFLFTNKCLCLKFADMEIVAGTTGTAGTPGEPFGQKWGTTCEDCILT